MDNEGTLSEMKSRTMNWLGLCAIAAVMSAGCAEEKSEPDPNTLPPVPTIKVVGQIVQVSVNAEVSDSPGYVWTCLSTALKEYPKAALFQVAWHIQVLGAHISSTAFYNRRQQTLKYSSIRYDSAGASHHERALYRNVTDVSLQKLAAQPQGGGSADAGLSVLSPVKAGATSHAVVKYLRPNQTLRDTSP